MFGVLAPPKGWHAGRLTRIHWEVRCPFPFLLFQCRWVLVFHATQKDSFPSSSKNVQLIQPTWGTQDVWILYLSSQTGKKAEVNTVLAIQHWHFPSSHYCWWQRALLNKCTDWIKQIEVNNISSPYSISLISLSLNLPREPLHALLSSPRHCALLFYLHLRTGFLSHSCPGVWEEQQQRMQH